MKPAHSRQAPTSEAYRRFYTLAPDMFAIVDAQSSRILDCNPALVDATGYPREELLGRNVFELCDPRGTRRAEAFSRKFVLTGETLKTELELRRQDGQLVPVSVSVSVGSRDDTGRVSESILILHDVTRRRRDEAALKASEARYQDLYHKAPDMLASLNPVSHHIVQCNETLASVTGRSRAELMGRPIYDILGDPSCDVARNALRAAVRSGNVRNVDLQLLRQTGPARDVSMHVTTVRDEQDNTYCRLVLRDITERKHAQELLRAAHDEMEERVQARTAELARSNDELEQFAYVASHDLQEPLRKIRAFGERLESHASSSLDGESRDYLERMVSAAQRMQALISDLLELSRVMTRGKPLRPTDLNAVIREVLSDLDGRLQEAGGEVNVESLAMVDADASQMRSLFQNLIGNALKFHAPDARPFVTIRGLRVPEDTADDRPRYQISVSDNGIGFDEKYKDRVFVPFQRLHSRSTFEGTGIGLPICRRIAERHGGTLTCRSAPGQGATFVVTLPVSAVQEDT